LKKRIRYLRLIWIKHDLPAGLAVFFVALPLCLGIALASGAPLYAGILTGIIGGLVVTPLSGSAMGVSGPAAGLSPVVAAAILAYGDYRIFLLAVIIAGLFQLSLGALKLGIIAHYFPSAVIKGMLAAIGIMLIAKQVPVALGYDQPDFWRSGFLNFFSSTDVSGNLTQLKVHTSAGVIVITVLSVLLLLIFQQPFAKKWKLIPAPLIAVLAGVGLTYLFASSLPNLQLKPTQLVNIPDNIFGSIVFPDFSQLFAHSSIWKDGIVIGLLASLETLLCVEAIDKLDRHNRITPVNRELMAQGVGNITCGFLGAIPMTAVIVRGAANIDAGARTRLSSFTHGFFLLVSVLFIPFLLNKIPYASLAAILLITGWNLTTPKLYRHMWSLGTRQFLPFILTIVIILFTDLLIGVTAGLLLSAYYIISNNFKAEYRIQKRMVHETEVYVIRLNSNVTFLNKVKLKEALDKIPPYSELTIDGSECNFIDYDILEIISEYEAKAHDRHISVALHGIEKVNVTAVH
jgi:MFS superfamily sulfate permease-like transporter